MISYTVILFKLGIEGWSNLRERTEIVTVEANSRTEVLKKLLQGRDFDNIKSIDIFEDEKRVD